MVLLLLVEPDAELAALRPLGGFFALRTGEPPRGPLPTLAQVYAAPSCEHAADPLTVRVRRVAEGIRAPEARVATSVAHQGLAARLWSVALGCTVRYGQLPDLAPDLLRWDPTAGAPDDLWLTEVRPTDNAPVPDTVSASVSVSDSDAESDSDDADSGAAAASAAAAALARVVLLAHLEPLAATLRARHRLAPGLLRGNAASALVGAARQLGGWARANDRPEAAQQAHDLAVRLLAHPALAGAGTPGTWGARGTTGFRRRSCCLYYRVPGGGVCGDCCFTRVPRSSPRAASG
ncbi:(2Fe-2S)-binding protein [Streptomyces sp. NPDC056160]|uniref:(2Fe-2S)-binding protein n=1 Tax=Streptomyces sp. NPDC056160 TaxID=3345731 RepID=UPI0035E23CC6